MTLKPATSLIGAAEMVLLADSTLGADAASFDLTAIDQTYVDLVLVLVCRSARAASSEDSLSMRFNNDSGANYDSAQTQVYAAGNYNGGTVVGSVVNPIGATSFAQVGNMPAASSVAGAHAEVTIEIANYAATTFRKGYFSRSSAKLADSATNVRCWISSGEWRSTAAITRVTVFPTNADFLAGSRCTLYGRGHV